MQFANTFLNECHKAASISSLDTAITLHRDALHIRTLPHASRPASLSSLASALYSRFYRTGQLQDLDEAVSIYRESLTSSSHPGQLAWLHSLSAALLVRFGKTGQLLDLQDAISLYSGLLNQGSKETRKAAQERRPQYYVSDDG
jgi:hypothetical protein